MFVWESNLAGAIFGLYLGTYWPASTERYVTDPDPLTKRYDWFRTAVLQAEQCNATVFRPWIRA